MKKFLSILKTTKTTQNQKIQMQILYFNCTFIVPFLYQNCTKSIPIICFMNFMNLMNLTNLTNLKNFRIVSSNFNFSFLIISCLKNFTNLTNLKNLINWEAIALPILLNLFRKIFEFNVSSILNILLIKYFVIKSKTLNIVILSSLLLITLILMVIAIFV